MQLNDIDILLKKSARQSKVMDSNEGGNAKKHKKTEMLSAAFSRFQPLSAIHAKAVNLDPLCPTLPKLHRQIGCVALIDRKARGMRLEKQYSSLKYHHILTVTFYSQ